MSERYNEEFLTTPNCSATEQGTRNRIDSAPHQLEQKDIDERVEQELHDACDNISTRCARDTCYEKVDHLSSNAEEQGIKLVIF